MAKDTITSQRDLEKVIDAQEIALSKILDLTQKSKIGPVPKRYGVSSWCAGYEAALANVQEIINEYTK